MQNIVDLVILVTVTALLPWLSIRAWRSPVKIVKWAGAGLAAVLAAAFCLASVLTIAGLHKLHARNAPIPNLKVDGTPEQVRRGETITESFCAACHSKTGPLTGDMNLGEDFPINIGSFVSSNLTPAGVLGHWSDGEIFRAIRNGVGADGTWLTVMSYTSSGNLSDDDIEAVIAYLRRQPPAGRQTVEPPDQFNLLGIIMLGVGMLPSGKPVLTGAITAPPKGPTAQYGEYILSFQDCRQCHGTRLAGGVPGQLGPLGPDLNLVKYWKPDEFIATMRTGVDPNGHQLSKEMPWRPIGKMDDEELRSIYEYLVRLPSEG